jgi:hypothetical protein
MRRRQHTKVDIPLLVASVRPEDMYTEPLPHPDRVKVDGNGGLQAGGEWEGDGAMQDEEWNDDVDAEGDNDDDDPENGISSADQ